MWKYIFLESELTKIATIKQKVRQWSFHTNGAKHHLNAELIWGHEAHSLHVFWPWWSATCYVELNVLAQKQHLFTCILSISLRWSQWGLSMIQMQLWVIVTNYQWLAFRPEVAKFAWPHTSMIQTQIMASLKVTQISNDKKTD